MVMYVKRSCSECGAVIQDWSQDSPDIGQPFTVCNSCGAVIKLRRTTEWDLKSVGAKAAFIANMIYACLALGILGILVGLFIVPRTGLRNYGLVAYGLLYVGVVAIFAILYGWGFRIAVRESRDRLRDPAYRKLLHTLGFNPPEPAVTELHADPGPDTGRVYQELSPAQKDAVLSQLRELMLEGIVEQNALSLTDPVPKEAPHGTSVGQTSDDSEDDRYSIADIAALLRRLGTHRVRRILVALDAGIPASDWAQNCLALCYGSPGSLKAAVRKREPDIFSTGSTRGDDQVLAAVETLLQIGGDTRMLHYLNAASPERLRRVCRDVLASADT
jgi:hypothetical protein